VTCQSQFFKSVPKDKATEPHIPKMKKVIQNLVF